MYVPVNITKFRQNLFQLVDQALKGEPVEFIHKGVVFKVVPETPISKLSRLTPGDSSCSRSESRHHRAAEGNGS